MTNSIRPGRPASLLTSGEAQTRREVGKPVELKGSVRKRRRGLRGGWRRKGRKVVYVKQGDLSGVRTEFKPERRRADRAGVRAPIVALKRGNARGAKGRRKVEA